MTSQDVHQVEDKTTPSQVYQEVEVEPHERKKTDLAGTYISLEDV